MVPVRDARELLYRMLRAGFLTLQVRRVQMRQIKGCDGSCSAADKGVGCLNIFRGTPALQGPDLTCRDLPLLQPSNLWHPCTMVARTLLESRAHWALCCCIQGWYVPSSIYGTPMNPNHRGFTVEVLYRALFNPVTAGAGRAEDCGPLGLAHVLHVACGQHGSDEARGRGAAAGGRQPLRAPAPRALRARRGTSFLSLSLSPQIYIPLY